MKNATRWVVLGVVVLVGLAVWREVQYRRAQGPPGSPARQAVTQPGAPEQAPPAAGHRQPAPESGLLIG